jgi:hypothetical protein
MQSGWVARLFFGIVAALAIAGVVGGTACTRWGQPGPVTPTIAPLTSIYVDASTGSDTSGNGSMAKPYKTLTKAVEVLAAAKSLSPSGVTIYLGTGDYNVANGEKFPIVVPTNVTITGTNYGFGTNTGSFVNGLGEDTMFEGLVHAPAHSAYTTLEIAPPASVSLSDVYVGAAKISLPSSRAFYASLDDLGTFSGSDSSLGAGIISPLLNVDGTIVPGGSFTCTSCTIRGNDFGIGAFSVPVATASPLPSPVVPSVTLSRSVGDSTVTAKVVDLLTDGSVNVTSSDEHFQSKEYAYSDAFTPIVYTAIRGAVDFGGGVAASSGGNVFIGVRITELWVTRRYETISAQDDTWNPNQQHANRYGQYSRKRIFGSGASGKNVTILRDALGSTVTVGPAPVPTPTPSVSPSTSPTSSPT